MIEIERNILEKKITQITIIYNGDSNQITITKKSPKITIPNRMIADHQYPGCECPSHLSDDTVEFILDQQGPIHMRMSNGVFVNAGQAVDLPIAEDIMVKVHANPNESEEDDKFWQSAEALHKVDCSQELDMDIDSNPEKESQSKCYLL